ncbi:type II toxin-antitoxin system RelB/DinJ family antitoxin [Peptoniphilus sp. AGMB00490]|uniref:Type II toxin-antitoxin system RelB/DinJ family antitoxin n=1 Tax=Peptoniphilus faecalis TaxID=2731255 RepID=A0A848R8T3_9FIRM|nr:type II toxin-antitoxin system RelB/DinJ family antitoxin [Peptoniphilus faecalis]NMW84228.1 type II toxin-antitoxin system RelB/DinJ family antitoxin [Peptoniphilus faecalis]
MSMSSINFRIDSKLKEEMKDTCNRLGLDLTSAFTIYVRKVVSEQRIPFEISVSDNSLLGPYNSFDDILREIDEEIYAENLSNK